MVPRDETSNELAESTVREPDLRATEDQMNMRGTLAPRIDRFGSKIEDLAGTGELDTPGG
jgi:hypothetical protein